MSRRRTAHDLSAATARRQRKSARERASGAAGVALRRRILWFAPLLLLAAGVLLYLRFLPVSELRIEGQLHMLSERQLRQNLQPHLQKGFLGLDLQQVRRMLMRMPWVQNVYVQRTWPPGLLVRLKERQPYAHWGEEHYINEQGAIFPASFAKRTLPQLHGPDGREQEVLSRYREWLPLLAGVDLSLQGVSLDGPCCWRLRLDCGGEIVAGLPGATEEVRRFTGVYQRLVGQSGSALERADLRYPNGLAVAWHGASPDVCREKNSKNGETP